MATAKNIIYLSVRPETPAKGYWDMALLGDLLADCQEIQSTREVKNAIVIIPGAYQGDCVDKINMELSHLEKCTVIVTSDEENKFPLEKLCHPNMDLLSTNPYATRANVTWLPVGYTPHVKLKHKEWRLKTIELFYAGQNNHADRNEMIQSLTGTQGELHISQGFGQGLDPQTYIDKMSKAKVVSAPRGNINADTFRLYEALELGAVPIAQNKSYWDKLFGTYPFPVIENHNQWRGYVQDAQCRYPQINIECQSWWARTKHQIKARILGELTAPTVIMPISPIPSHPATAILEKTLASVVYHFPSSKVVLAFDGIRPEHEHMRQAYDQHIQQILHITSSNSNIYPIIFKDHKHQVGILREILPTIATSLILFIEQDTPLVTDELIEWEKIKQFILSGQSNLVRLYHEAILQKEHTHMMLQQKDAFTETAQWSSRPHMASTAFYARILQAHFSPTANCFTEDVLHGKAYEDYVHYSRHGWDQWRLHIYNPGTQNIKRSYHLDGRAGAPKLDNTQTW